MSETSILSCTIDIPFFVQDICKLSQIIEKEDKSTYLEDKNGKMRTESETHYAKVYWKDGCVRGREC